MRSGRRSRSTRRMPKRCSTSATCAADGARLAAAIGIYEEALRHHPRDALLLNNLGLAFEESGEIDAAMARYEQALAAPGPPAEAHANLARLLAAASGFPRRGHALPRLCHDRRRSAGGNLVESRRLPAPARRVARRPKRVTARRSSSRPTAPRSSSACRALLVEVGRSDEAIRQACSPCAKERPSGHVTHALLTARQLVCDWTDWAATVDEIRAHVGRLALGAEDTLVPLNALALPLSLAEQLAIARRFADTFRAAAPASPGSAAPGSARTATADRIRLERFPPAPDRLPAHRALGKTRPQPLRGLRLFDRARRGQCRAAADRAARSSTSSTAQTIPPNGQLGGYAPTASRSQST